MTGFHDAAKRAQTPIGPAFRVLWAAAFIIPVLAFTGAAYLAYHSVMTETRAHLHRTVDLLHEHTLRLMEIGEGLLIAVSDRAKSMEWEAMAASPEMHALLKDIDDATFSTGGIGVISPDGIMVSTSRLAPPLPVLDMRARSYVTALRPGPAARPDLRGATGVFVSEVFKSVPGNRILFALSKPVPGRDGKPGGGIVVVTIMPETLSGFYREIVQTSGDAVTLLRVDGAILARHPAPDSPAGSMAPADSAIMRAMHDNPQGRGVYETHSAFDGTDRIIAYRRVTGYPLFITYGLDAKVPMSLWSRQLLIPGVSAVAAAILLLTLTGRAHNLAVERIARETARAETESRLRHMERVATLGELAAGVAHDFRNASQNMASAARLIDKSANDPEKVRTYAAAIGQAAMRASALTDRMTAFVRRPGEEEEIGATFDPKASLRAATELLSSTLGPGYRIAITSPAAPMVAVHGAAGEFEAAIVNLVVNARDAMRDGGDIRLSCHISPDDEPAPSLLPPGRYGVVRVADQGTGMDEATLAQAGQAFFTTKPRGRGTGLGLSTARAFAERAGGMMTIDSAVGKGTTVALWLPTAMYEVRPAEPVA